MKDIITQACATGELPVLTHTPAPPTAADTIFLSANATLLADASVKTNYENLAALLSMFSRGLAN